MIITIDGPSGTGKSTVAKGVAQALGFMFFDTGAMYRSMAWWLTKLNINLEDQEAIHAQLPFFKYKIQGTELAKKYVVDEIDITEKIRSHEISQMASKIAAYPEVRKALVEIQRTFGRQVDAVFEGRDMGTIVFPNAEIKIFLTAKLEIRAYRRYLELKAKNPNSSFSLEQISQDIQQRDLNDSSRLISPLKQADDAFFIDTSFLSTDQVIEQILTRCKTGGQ